MSLNCDPTVMWLATAGAWNATPTGLALKSAMVFAATIVPDRLPQPGLSCIIAV